MPTYEYGCRKQHITELFCSMSKRPKTIKCEECGELAHRQISAGAGIIFKGTGFYSTDYGKSEGNGRK